MTNGRDMLPEIDGRTLWARRLRDVVTLHVADLGGDEAISEAVRSIIRRAATLTVALEKLEAQFALEGDASPADLDRHQRAAGNLRRLLESVGLERRNRDLIPTLEGYIASREVS